MKDPIDKLCSNSVVVNDESGFRALDEVGPKPSNVILAEESYAIVGAAMEVYYKLGSGFAEPVYQEALEIEFGLRGVQYEREKWLKIDYKGHTLKKEYKADFVCFGQIIVELKAVPQLAPVDWAQIMNYLKVSHLRLGILLNFGSSVRLEQKRVII